MKYLLTKMYDIIIYSKNSYGGATAGESGFSTFGTKVSRTSPLNTEQAFLALHLLEEEGLLYRAS